MASSAQLARPAGGPPKPREGEIEQPSKPGVARGAGQPGSTVAQPPAPTESPVMTVNELAALLRVNRKSVYEAIARGEIPGVRRIGRSFRASREAVLAWLREGRVSRSRRY
jgi:excisionase family DNA binding protein